MIQDTYYAISSSIHEALMLRLLQHVVLTRRCDAVLLSRNFKAKAKHSKSPAQAANKHDVVNKTWRSGITETIKAYVREALHISYAHPCFVYGDASAFVATQKRSN